jgi:hypothetical protein
MSDPFFCPQVTSRLSLEERRYLLAHVLRFESLYVQAAQYMTPQLWSAPEELFLRIAWQAALDSEMEWGRPYLFGQRVRAWVTLHQRCEILAQQYQLPADQRALLFQNDPLQPGFLPWTYSNLPQQAFDLERGQSLLARFLTERWIQDPARELFQRTQEETLVELPTLLEELHQRQKTVQALMQSPIEDPFPSNWRPAIQKRQPTQVPFLDQMLHGGHMPGEVYAILGAFGSGKTILAVQLAVGAARAEQERFYYHPDTPLRRSYLFHYEAGLNEMRCRVLSHAAQVDREAIAHWDLSRRGRLKPYEKKLFAAAIQAQGMDLPGEAERIEAVLPSLRRNLCLVDMSGPQHRPKQGSGGIAEIEAILTGERRRGWQPCCVVIDYAGLVVRRYVLENRVPERQEYLLLTHFGHECHRRLAAAFQTPVWIIHQLSGAANARDWHERLSHADAQGSKSFAENLWYCFELGTMNREHRAAKLWCSKARWGEMSEPQLVYLHYPVSTMRLATHLIEQEEGHLSLRPGTWGEGYEVNHDFSSEDDYLAAQAIRAFA